MCRAQRRTVVLCMQSKSNGFCWCVTANMFENIGAKFVNIRPTLISRKQGIMLISSKYGKMVTCRMVSVHPHIPRQEKKLGASLWLLISRINPIKIMNRAWI